MLPMLPPEMTIQSSDTSDQDPPSTPSQRPRTPEQAHPAPPVPSTPVQIRLSSRSLFSSGQVFRDKSFTAMAKEMKNFIVGPMPPQAFLDTFFPTENLWSLGSVPPFQGGLYNSTLVAQFEVQAYGPFIESTKRFLPGFCLRDSHKSDDRNPNIHFPSRIRPDVIVYHDNVPSDLLTDSSLLEIAIEFKWLHYDDPFCDSPKPKRNSDGTEKRCFINDSQLANDTLGQISTYAAAQLGSQFRTHAFSVLIVREFARILRWDRSGVIVTAAIPYNKDPLLVEFFRRYSKAPPDMRGIDRSVSALNPKADDAIAARTALGFGIGVPLFKLEIPNPDGSSGFFITTSPQAIFFAPPGRATRGFHAYNISKKKPCFLKDTWRVDLPGIQEEGLTYDILAHAPGGVRNIPECVAFGDISTMKYHATTTPGYASEHWSLSPTYNIRPSLIPHRHYRLALDVIGRSLLTFTSSYELVNAVRDAIYAHRDAFVNARVLHRDLSPGNIVIDDNGKGVLIDWDLSRTIDQGCSPRRATRTGTWQFMSGKLISKKDHVHDFTDDLESTIYILLWVALTYSGCSDRTKVAGFFKSVLNPEPEEDSTYTGKPQFLRAPQFLEDVKFVGRPHLDNLLIQLSSLFAHRYLPSPPKFERDLQAKLKGKALMEQDPFNSEPWEDHQSLLASHYDRQLELLKDHEETIRLFDDALKDRSLWPADDKAEHQNIPDTGNSSTQRVRKTGFSAIPVVWEIAANQDIVAL